MSSVSNPVLLLSACMGLKKCAVSLPLMVSNMWPNFTELDYYCAVNVKLSIVLYCPPL